MQAALTHLPIGYRNLIGYRFKCFSQTFWFGTESIPGSRSEAYFYGCVGVSERLGYLRQQFLKQTAYAAIAAA